MLSLLVVVILLAVTASLSSNNAALPAPYQILSTNNFERHVLVSGRPWVVVFTAGIRRHQVELLADIAERTSMFRDHIHLGFVNATSHPRLASRFGLKNMRRENGLVLGFHADSKGLGSHNQVSYHDWNAAPRNSSVSDTLFKRLTSKMLRNFVDILPDGESAEVFLRPKMGIGLRDEFVPNIATAGAPVILYFSAKDLRKPPPEFVDDRSQSTSSETDELTPAEMLANVPTELALLSLKFVGRLKFGFVPRSADKVISTFQVTSFPALIACVIEANATSEDDYDRLDSDVQGHATVSPYKGPMSYAAVQSYLDQIVSTRVSERGDDWTIQRVHNLRAQCGSGPSATACLVIVLPAKTQESDSTTQVSNVTNSEELLRQLQPLSRELAGSARVLWTSWEDVITESRSKLQKTSRLLRRLGLHLQYHFEVKRHRLREGHRQQMEKNRQQAKRGQSAKGTSQTGEGSAAPDAKDPFGTRKLENLTSIEPESVSLDPAAYSVFLINLNRGRFSGFLAKRAAQLSPLALRQFLYENTQGLVETYSIADVASGKRRKRRKRRKSNATHRSDHQDTSNSSSGKSKSKPKHTKSASPRPTSAKGDIGTNSGHVEL